MKRYSLNDTIILQMFLAFTNGSGKIEPRVNGTFQMFGGNVNGIITEMVKSINNFRR